MDLRGEHRIPARRERVWALLNDPDTLRACIPGCDSLDQTAPDAFTARVTTKVGPVKATFDGAVTLTELNPPTSYRIVGEGKGGVAGFARGSADVRLADDGDGTILSYAVDAKVGGKLAQLGGRLIESTARKLAGQFFDCFAARAAEGASPDGAVARFDAAPLGAGMAGVGVPIDAADIPPRRLDDGHDRADFDRASSARTGEADGPAVTYAPVEDEARHGGILSGLAGAPLVGAAGHTTTGISEDRAEVEAALHLDEPAVTDTPEPRATAPVGGYASATPELGAPARSDPHRPNPMERAEAELERQAAGGALGGPVVWGLLVLAALIAIYFLAT